jgi:hypothetical protein
MKQFYKQLKEKSAADKQSNLNDISRSLEPVPALLNNAQMPRKVTVTSDKSS